MIGGTRNKGPEGGSPIGVVRQDQASQAALRLLLFQHPPQRQGHVMRPSVHRSRNALFLSARRYQHHVSAQKQPSGLEAANHQAGDANGAQSSMERLRVNSFEATTNRPDRFSRRQIHRSKRQHRDCVSSHHRRFEGPLRLYLTFRRDCSQASPRCRRKRPIESRSR